MIKVLIDAHMLSNNEGGNSRYIEGIGEAKLYPKDIKIALYKSKTHSIINDAARILWGLSRKASLIRADIIHSTYFCPLFTSKKIVLTVHDFLFCSHPEYFSLKDRLLFKYLLPISLKKASAVIVPSEFSKHEGIKYFPDIKNKIFVTYEAADKKFRRARKPGNYFMTFNGNKRKNVDSIVKAFIKLQRKDLKLIVVGKQKNDDKKMTLRENILYMEKVTDKRLIDMYPNAIATPYNSFYEGFNLPILESAMSGTPLILSDIPVHKEIAGTNALYVNPKNISDLTNKMKMVLNKRTNQKYSKLSYELSKKYSWKSTVLQTANIYKWVKEN